MTKPSSILRQEFIESQINLINTSGLPAFVLVDIIEDTLLELRKLAQDQYKKDCAEWEEFQRQEAEKDKNKTIEQKETK